MAKHHFSVWIEIIQEFIKEHGYDKLKHRTVYKGLKIGVWRNEKRQKYKKLSTEEEREAMRKEFSTLPDDFLECEVSLTTQDWINLILEFINEHGYNEFKKLTIYKEYKIGNWRDTQRQIYKRLKTNKEREAMKKEFALLPVDFLESITVQSTQDWINLTLEFINEHGYENLKQRTSYKGLMIGTWYNQQKKVFKQLKTDAEREAMRKEFALLPVDFLESNTVLSTDEWIHFTFEYFKEFGTKNLQYNTVYKGHRIGAWRSTQRNIYKNLKTDAEREAMLEKFFVLSPKEFLFSISRNRKTKTN